MLAPKLDSLLDAFESLNLHFACITEMWFKWGKALGEKLVDLEGGKGIRILHKSRKGRLSGGGVAVAFNTGRCNSKQRNLKHIYKEHEVLCVVGRIWKIKRKFVVFSVYIPQNTRNQGHSEICDAILLEIAAVKVSYDDPIIIVGGDFNHSDLGGALEEDFHRIVTALTRGGNMLDMIYTNVPNNVVEQVVLPPLQSNTGMPSEHQCVFAAVELG